MKRTELPTQPWQDLAADLLGPLPTDEYLLVSRFFDVAVSTSVTSGKIISCLEAMFATHGLPLSIKTENGPQFLSEEFEAYLKDNNIEHRTSTALRRQAHGEVERQNRSLLIAMRVAHNEGRYWRKELQKLLLGYRRKQKGKDYADNLRGACESNLQEGDKILLQNPSRISCHHHLNKHHMKW